VVSETDPVAHATPSLARAASAGSPAARASVPLAALDRIHRGLKGQLLDDIAELIDSGEFTHGPAVGRFEEAFAAYCGSAHCVGVSSGLDALRLALLATGIEAGDEVVVPALTFVATFEAVAQAGGRIVVADVSERDYCLDVDAAAAAVGARTRMLLPVHLYGQMADVRVLRSIADRECLDLIEDACQAHGASREGCRAGTAGAAGAFSFYPGKNLGAMGDAGALVTSRLELAATARALREHGQTARYRHELAGYTARLDTLQALVLLRKLPLLDAWNRDREAAAGFYAEALAGVGDVRLPPAAEASRHVWHLYVVRTGRREALARFLLERGIATGRHYPEPPHLTRAFERLGYRRGAFPVAESLSAELVTLPLFPGITDEELQTVSDSVMDFFRRG
jgi:dTDP-4-amino-4,6-dideoxygalactose transaminase